MLQEQYYTNETLLNLVQHCLEREERVRLQNAPQGPAENLSQWEARMRERRNMNFAQAYGSRARTMGEAVRGPNLQNIPPNENAAASYPNLQNIGSSQQMTDVARQVRGILIAELAGASQAPNPFTTLNNAQDGAVVALPDTNNYVSIGYRSTVPPEQMGAYAEQDAALTQRLMEGLVTNTAGAFKMNENFFLTGDKEIRPTAPVVIIRSWAILNTGERPVIVHCHSNNSPRMWSTVIEPGEQFIDANCSLERLVLHSEGTQVELFHAPNSQSQWRFKSLEKIKPVQPSVDDDFNPVYHQQIAPVVPILETEEEKKDAPAAPIKPAAGEPVLRRSDFFQRPLY